MHILIAPNAFKNALPADEAAAAIERGLWRSGLTHNRPTVTTECFPVGDGGDGTGDLLIDCLRGDRIPAKARDPLGRIIDTYIGITPTRIAIIEMANASGLRLLNRDELNPLHTSSAGTGDLIRAALDNGARKIIIGMGGSATVDGGIGILEALGARFPDLSSIDLTDLDPRLATTELIVLCDVTNPLTGPDGAAIVFGPQKGATPAAVRQLESNLRQFAQIIFRYTGKNVADLPRAGTAGGAAAGLHGLLNATLVSGIDYFLEITHFNEALNQSTLVITGEGSIDQQTLQGKAPFGVAAHAKARGLPVIALTGRLPDPAPLRPYFDEIISINPPGITLPEALANTAANLERTAMEWGNRLTAAP